MGGRGPARLGYNLDSADLAPANWDPVRNGSGGHSYQTSNQNQGQSQRYKPYRMYVAITHFTVQVYTKKEGGIKPGPVPAYFYGPGT